jgi:hypothetical protein
MQQGRFRPGSGPFDPAAARPGTADLQSTAFIKSLTENAHSAANLTNDDAEGESIRNQKKKTDAKISHPSDLLSETTSPEPADTKDRRI